MQEKINILYVNFSLNVGGIETLMLELSRRLDLSRYRPMVCVFEPNGKLEEEFLKSNIPVHIVRKRKGIDFTLPIRLARLFKAEHADIVHTQNQSSWLYSVIAAKLTGISLVHTVHTSADYSGHNSTRWTVLEKILAMFTDRITAVAESNMNYMVKKEHIQKERIQVIHNGIDKDIYNKQIDIEAKKHELGFENSDFIIGNVARFFPNKDQKTLIKAFDIVSKKISTARLLMAGDGPLRTDMEQLVEHLGLRSKVIFLGNRRDVPELLKIFNVFVLPSLREGLPVSILEAMASGLPVIATDVDGNGEVVIDTKTGFLIPPADPIALARAIVNIYEDEELAQKMGEEGRKNINNSFSFDIMIKKYEAVYANIAKGKSLKIGIIGEFPPTCGGMAAQAGYLAENLTKEGLSVSTIDRGRGLIRAIISNLRIFNLIFTVDIFYVFTNSHLSFYLHSVIPVIVGKLFGKKAIIAYHGGAAEKFLSRKINFLAKAVLKIADIIIVPSGYLRDIFKKVGLETIVIPNIINTNRFAFRDRDKISPRLIMARHLEPEYNVGLAIKALKIIIERYPDARLTICGDGSEEVKLKELAESLKIANSVEFLGSVDNDKIADVYHRSDIFLNCSNVDNQPVAILEAFACGLPVVTTKAGGIPYMVENGKTGLLVELNDHEGMAKSVMQLVEDPQLAKKLVMDARDGLKRHGWGSIKLATVSMLRGHRMGIYQNTIFRALDMLRGRKNIDKLKFLRNSQYWEKCELEKWQLAQLNKVLAVAKEKSPFYKEKLKNIRLPIANISQLQNVPILTKKEIKANKECIKCTGFPKSRFILGKTGGSTGEPMHYYYDKRGRDWNRGSVYRSQEWAGTYLGEKTIQMTGSHYDYTEFKKLKWKFIFWLQHYKILPISFVNDEIFEEYYKELVTYKPTSIWGYSSGIYYFAKFIEEKYKNTDFSFLKGIITSSETLHGFQREKIGSVFGEDKIYDHYGSREFYVASECSAHNGYHIHAETILVEIVDNNGKHKKPGELGRILITDLSNLVFPFIRYEIGDVGIMSKDDNCSCGISLPKLASIEGRIADVVVLNDRVLTPPNFNNLLGEIDGIEQYQVTQNAKTALILNIVKNDCFTKESEDYIRKSLAKLAGEYTSVDIKYVDNIDVPLSGKRRYIVSEISESVL